MPKTMPAFDPGDKAWLADDECKLGGTEVLTDMDAEDDVYGPGEVGILLLCVLAIFSDEEEYDKDVTDGDVSVFAETDEFVSPGVEIEVRAAVPFRGDLEGETTADVNDNELELQWTLGSEDIPVTASHVCVG
ncbi:hypothetical protein CPC08DRAFT_703576 [Agrocybe pediades]|nr:hypothetical protein CPC08DRAFT_703576 [Agrocybe pediades]